MLPDIRCDLAIVGGGLAGGLIAYALAARRPELSVRLIEPGETLGGNHIWSFFSNDVEPEDRWLTEPFVSKSWNGYRVKFPRHERELGVQYNAIRSERFDSVLREALPQEAVIRGRATHVRPNGVALENGQIIRARGVVDAGGAGPLRLLDLGWQKFLGQELRLTAAHRLERPIVMDATVTQDDGYRFVYVLPFATDRLFVEDTYYSDKPMIEKAVIKLISTTKIMPFWFFLIISKYRLSRVIAAYCTAELSDRSFDVNLYRPCIRRSNFLFITIVVFN